MIELSVQVALLAAIGLAGLIKALQLLGVVPMGTVAEAEAERAKRAEAALVASQDALRRQSERLLELERRTDLGAIIEKVTELASLQAATIERLEDVNGGLGETRAALRETNHGLKSTRQAVQMLVQMVERLERERAA